MSQITPSSQFEKIEVGSFARQRVFNTFQALNGGIDLGESTQTDLQEYTGNMGGQWANITAPAGANTEFAVPHDLGRIPSFYFYNIDRSGILYQLPDTLTVWTDTNIYVKCSAASAVLRIFII